MAEEINNDSERVSQSNVEEAFAKGDDTGNKLDGKACESKSEAAGPIDQDSVEKELGLRLSVSSVSSLQAYQTQLISREQTQPPLKILNAAKEIFVPGRSQLTTDQGDQIKQVAHGIRTQFLLERALVLCSKSCYAEAVTILDNPCVPESNLFLPRLLLAECHMHLGNSRRAEDNIAAVARIVITSGMNYEEIKECADGFIADSHYARAIVLYRITCYIIESSMTPSDFLLGVYFCLSKVDDATRPMISEGGNSRKVGIEYGLRFMIEMFKILKNVKAVSMLYSAEMEAYSCAFISTNLYLAGAYKKGVEYCKIGIDAMELQFGPKAIGFYIYGRLLHRAGAGLYNLEEFSEAEAYYLQAIDACVTAKCLDVGRSCEETHFETLKSELSKTRAKLPQLYRLGTKV